MGMYTRLELDSHLRHNTPEAAVEVLHIMCRSGQHLGNKRREIRSVLDLNPELDHELFDSVRATWMFRCDGGLGETLMPELTRQECTGVYRLTVAFSVKNYERVINNFLQWLSPFVWSYRRDKVLGLFCYEEDLESSDVVWNGRKLVIVPPKKPSYRDYDEHGRHL